MTRTAILAVDGGSSKTDVALIDDRGRVLGTARGPGIPYASIGLDAAMERLALTVAACRTDASRHREAPPVADVGVYCLPGMDLGEHRRPLARALAGREWSRRQLVHNDTFAVLRAGTDRAWGVAVVGGTALNCLGIGRRGRAVRFPALGWVSGDLGGGFWLGQQTLAAAVRGRDGRGPRTILERLVPAHFGLSLPAAVGRAVLSERLDAFRVVELAPIAFAAAAAGDLVARAILDRLADEVVALAVATLRRLRAVRTRVDVVLGGGLFHDNDDDDFLGRIRQGIKADAPLARVVQLAAPPVAGAALIGLDAVGAGADGARRARAGLTERRLSGAR